MERKRWTEEELKMLRDGYANYEPIKEIAKKLPGRSEFSISTKAHKMGLGNEFVKSNNANFKAVYQNYDWLFDQLIVQGKTPKQISEETGYKKRVICKWADIHKLNSSTFKYLVNLTSLQREIILAGTLGDGHIAEYEREENFGIYIESHAIIDKDYLFWKYNILKNLCLSEPRYYEGKIKKINNKEYLCKPFYRFHTRAIIDLLSIKHMTKFERINELTELGIATHFLDDASRSNDSWEICFGDWSLDEMEYYIANLKNKFGLDFKIVTCDNRYASCNKENMLKLDKIILENIPNDLDIIKRKITERKK